MDSTKRQPPTDWPWERFGGPTGRMINVAHYAMKRQLENLLRPIGLTHPQWSALGIINIYPGVTHTEMEEILQVERSSITSLISGMEKKGWLTRKEHPEDARYKQIFLTDEGKRLAELTQNFTETVDNRLKEILTPDEIVMLRSLLKRLIQGFE